MPSAIDISSVTGLVAVGMFTAQILLGLLVAGFHLFDILVPNVHGVWADPLLKNRPVDFIDAEKVYVEACAVAVFVATTLRFRYARARRSNL